MNNTDANGQSSADDAADRTEYIGLRVTPAEKRAIKSAAQKVGRTMSAHLRQSATDTGTLPEPTIQVPEARIDAAAELAPLANNLNQIAHRAHVIWTILSETSAGVNDAESVFESARDAAEKAHEEVQSLRRDLVGNGPLATAADVLKNYRRGANTGKLEVDAETLEGVEKTLRELADELGEGVTS